jgi:hypothetical protein
MNSRTESLIGQASSSDLRIALHYEDAAKILYASGGYQDGITLPALFLIRQFLELILKYNIKKLNEISSCTDLMTKLTKEHDLEIIHNAFLTHYKSVKTINNIKKEPEKKSLDTLKLLISKISKLDSSSQGFRYSENIDGEKIIGCEETYNLQETFDLLEDASNFLAAIEDTFSS